MLSKISLLLVLAFSLTACTSGNTCEPSPKPADKSYSQNQDSAVIGSTTDLSSKHSHSCEKGTSDCKTALNDKKNCETSGCCHGCGSCEKTSCSKG
jgi:hypothetical protein